MRRGVRLFIRAALAVLLVAAIWLGWQAYRVYSDLGKVVNVTEKRTTAEPTVTIPPLNGTQRINFLVLGSDNDLKVEERHPLTQSMIIVTIDPLHHTVGMLSIPRDFWVYIRGVGMAKIDVASKYGGIPLARETVERLFGQTIDYYAWVGLNGFMEVVNSFGGVTVDVNHPILDDYYPDDLNSSNPYNTKRVFLAPGWRHLSGPQALMYVRSRHGDAIGDFGRSSRQQQVLLQLRKQINAIDVLTHLPELVSALKNSVRTDLGLTELYQLAQFSKTLQTSQIKQVVLQAPTYSHYGFAQGQDIVIPDWNKIRPVVRQMFAPIIPPRPRPQPTPVAGATASGAATPTARPAASGTAAPRPAPSATTAPTATPTPPPVTHLPGKLLVVQNGSLNVLNRDGTVQQQIANAGVSMPAVSPDGRFVAFVRYSKYASDIWVADRKTGRQRAVTESKSADPKAVYNNLWSLWPAWSGDGSRVLYSTDRAKLSVAPSEARPVDLNVWSTSPPGAPPQQLTSGTGNTALGAGGDTDVVWRPHTDQFAYEHWDYTQPNNAVYAQLFLRDLKTGQSWPLTAVGDRVLQPAFGPSGKTVAFVRTRQGSKVDELVEASVVGGAAAPHLANLRVVATGEVAEPSFTADGKWLSFMVGNGATFGLNMTPATGGAVRTVPAAGTNLDPTSRPVWLP